MLLIAENLNNLETNSVDDNCYFLQLVSNVYFAFRDSANRM